MRCVPCWPARPDFAARAQEDLSIWWQPEMVEQMLGDLRNAGFNSSEAVPRRRKRHLLLFRRKRRQEKTVRMKVSGSRCCRSNTRARSRN